MPVSLVPVDHDPFGGETGGGMSLAPVDYDPFDAEKFANPAVSKTLGDLATLPRRALEASAADVSHLGEPGYEKQSIAPAVETALTMMGGSGAVPAEANSLRAGIKAYHGSPHDFDAFSLDKIGTGEGAQAYGHGLYFAENEGTAKSYRDTLGMNNKRWLVDGDVVGQYGQNNTTKGLAAARLRQVMGEDGIVTPNHIEAAKKQLVSVSAKNPGVIRDVPGQLKAMESMSGNTIAEDGAGKMYEVNINADPAHFLDWDKPPSQQAPEVRTAIDDVMRKISPNGYSSHPDLGERSMASVMMDMAHKSITGGHAQTTEALAERGIPGIKYLDQGSRASGDGSRNYVVFNDKLIDIVRKYAAAGIALPPAIAAEYAKNFKPVDHDPFAQPKLEELLPKVLNDVLEKHSQNTRDHITQLHQHSEQTTDKLLKAYMTPRKIEHDADGRPVRMVPDVADETADNALTKVG